MIKTKDIRYSVPGKEIIKGIDIQIEKGKFYGILGPNGSGKTTLLDILAGIIEGWSGEIEVDSKGIDRYSKKDLAKVLALVPQNFDTSFPFSVEEVLEMVEEGEMPLGSYVRMHPGAELNSEEAARLMDWARDLRGASQGGGEAESGVGRQE